MQPSLIHITNEGDFNKVFKKYFTNIVYFATEIIKDKFTAKDIVMIVFEKLWLKRNDFENESAIKSFLYVATRNACLNHLKALRVRRFESTDILDNISLDKTIDQVIIESEVISNIFRKLNNLPPRSRRVMFETICGKKAPEIAKNMGITVSSVTSHRQRAIEILRKRSGIIQIQFRLIALSHTFLKMKA